MCQDHRELFTRECFSGEGTGGSRCHIRLDYYFGGTLHYITTDVTSVAPLLYINSPQPTSNLVTLHPGLYFRFYHHPPGHVFPQNHSEVTFSKQQSFNLPVIGILKQSFQFNEMQKKQ